MNLFLGELFYPLFMVFLVKINKPCEGVVRELGKDGIKFLKTKRIVGKNGYDNVPISALYSAPSFWNKKLYFTLYISS